MNRHAHIRGVALGCAVMAMGGGCSDKPSKPRPTPRARDAGVLSSTAADEIRAQVSAGELYLVDPATHVDLASVANPWAERPEGFYLHLRATDGDAWAGVVGAAPLVGVMEEEPFTLERSAPRSWEFASRWEPSRRATIRVLADDRIEVTENGAARNVVVGDPEASGLRSWYAARTRELLKAASLDAPALTTAGQRYAYEGAALTDCTVLAEDCELDRLVVSCRVGADRIVRIRAHREPNVLVLRGASPYDGASKCVAGPSGIRGPDAGEL